MSVETITPTLAFFFEVSQASHQQEDGHNASIFFNMSRKGISPNPLANVGNFRDNLLQTGKNVLMIVSFFVWMCAFAVDRSQLRGR